MSFVAANACGSLDAANDVCQGGDVVLVEGGLYPQSDITGSNGRSSNCIFDVPSGQTAAFGCDSIANGDGVDVPGASCIDVFGSYITLRHLTTQTYSYEGRPYLGRVDTERGDTNLVLEYNHFGSIAQGADNVVISHNELGPSMDPFNSRQADGSNVVWSDNYFHDTARMSAGHIECMFYEGTGSNVKIIYNLWKNCAVFDIATTPTGNMGANQLIDHNAFWEPDMAGGNNANVWVNTHGATSCPITVSNNWFGDGASQGDGVMLNCPGAVDGGGNTYHDPSVQPPSPVRP